MADINEGLYADDVVKKEADQFYSRDVVTIGTGADLAIGTVLGYVNAGSFAVAAAAADGGNTGDGTVALGSPAFGPDVMAGTYTLEIVDAETNLGQIEMTDPMGNVVDVFEVGTESAGTHLTVTVSDGAADFVLGDKFTLAVTQTAEGEYYALDLTATDGRQFPAGVLISTAAAAAADVADALIIARQAIVSANKLIWPAGITADQTRAGQNYLKALGIIVAESA